MQDRSYRRPPGDADSKLSEVHRGVLEMGSAIAPDVTAERGVRTVTKGRGQLPSTYSRRQKKRAPGILFAVHRPNGETSTIFRPDEPDPQNPGHKYEQPCKHLGGSGNVLDVHPSARHRVEARLLAFLVLPSLGAAARESPGHRLEGERLAIAANAAQDVALRLGRAPLRERRPPLALLHQEHGKVRRYQDDQSQRQQPQQPLQAHRVT